PTPSGARFRPPSLILLSLEESKASVCKSDELRRSFRKLEEITMRIWTDRPLAKLATAIALILRLTTTGLAASANENEVRPGRDDKLQSEYLLDLTLEAQTPQNLGSAGAGRLIVPVSGGSFVGPRLKGTIIPPGGDWI